MPLGLFSHLGLNDYNLLKSLVEYPNSDIPRVTINKLCGHLWYISPETMALAFFDSRIPKDTKLKIINAITSTDDIEDIKPKKINIRLSEVKEFVKTDFDDLVSPETLNFFQGFLFLRNFLMLILIHGKREKIIKKDLKLQRTLW